VLDTKLDLPGFGAEVLREEAISVIAPARHRLASASPKGASPKGASAQGASAKGASRPRTAFGRGVAPSDLSDDVILLPEAPDSGCAYRGQFERQLSDAQVSVDGAVEFASIETVKQCVIAGMGVSVLPRVAVSAEIEAGRLIELPWGKTFEVYTQIVWNARRSIAPAQAAFMSTAREVLRPS
jgi:DNA-binding transcriptional LysR family regulator